MKKKNIKKRKKFKFKYIIYGLFLSIFLLCFGFFIYICFNAPEFNSSLLYKVESSNIYDSKGNLITTIGNEKRQTVSYDELPQVLIDAIIATEDARFFEHSGIDIPRFLKASVSYLRGNNIGGASTLTMQISKNTFTNNNTKGIDGIIRKFTDIYLSIFKIERKYSKEDIIEFYVNSSYLGASSYGVQMASKTYFDKDVSNLNLIEATMLAGLFQAPNDYDPYVNINNTNNRKNEVIDLMEKHGYITSEQAKIAKNADIKSVIKEKNTNVSIYQGFIDTVVEEVIDKTGNNPYVVSMDIYSTMDMEKQDIINDFYNNHKFKDDKVQVGIGIIDNESGSIIAVGAGRNKTSEMSLNYATQILRHPGSTAKPLFDYGPGIEYYNWSTYTPFIDKPVKYTNGGYMKNVDNKYQGFLTLEQCLVKSRNTCALQAFKKIDNSKINSFVTSLGITPEYLYDNEYINEAHSIGGFTGVSPVMLASAYSAFGNGGYYTKYHSVKKIIYKNNDEEREEVFNYEKTKVMKDTTAYMMSSMLQKVTSSKVKVSGTEIATKTGTSSYDSNTLKNLGLSSNVIQDAWTVTFSKDYSVAIWYGYDSLSKKTYNTSNHAWSERTKIQAEIVNKVMKEDSKFDIPDGIIEAKVVVGTNPPKLASSSTPSGKVQTHIFIKGTEPTQSYAYVPKSSISNEGKNDDNLENPNSNFQNNSNNDILRELLP